MRRFSKYIWLFLAILEFSSISNSVQAQDFPELLNFRATPAYTYDSVLYLSQKPEPIDCANRMRWAAIRMKVFNHNREYQRANELYQSIVKACPGEQNGSMDFEQSVTLYYLQDFNGSIESMKSCINLLTEEQARAKASLFLNIGSAFNQMDQLDSALYWYDKAYQFDPPRATAMLFNNMASIKLKQEKFNDANHYLHLAESRMNEYTPSYLETLIKYNYLETYRNLGRITEAQEIYREIDSERLPRGAEIIGLNVLLSYCISIADTAEFLRISTLHLKLLESSSDGIMIQFSQLRQALERNDGSQRELWASLRRDRGNVPSTSDASVSYIDEKLSASYTKWRRGAIALSVIIVLAILVGLWAWRRKLNASKMLKNMVDDVRNEFSADENVQKIRSALEGKGPVDEAIDGLLRMDYELSLYKASDSSRQEIPWERLDATETEIIKLFLARKTVPEIARLRGCSVGHVYNVKTSIRKKLELSNETRALEKYLLQFT